MIFKKFFIHVALFAAAVATAAANKCENSPDPFTVGTKTTKCDKYAKLQWKKRDKKCKKSECLKHCPGICDKENCGCENIPFPLNKRGNTCAELVDFSKKRKKKKCRKELYLKGCPSICNGKQCDWFKKGDNINGEDTGDQSGGSVSVSSDGKVVAIGASNNDGNSGDVSGHVRVYEWNKVANLWKQKGGDIDGEHYHDYSGTSVSLNGDGSVVAIGAPFNDFNNLPVYNTAEGHVRVFEYNEVAKSWDQRGQELNGQFLSDVFGHAVAISSDGYIIAVGAPNNSDSVSYSGDVKVYEYIGSSWVQLGENIEGESEGDESGTSLSLSKDGKVVAIGAPWNYGNGKSSGHVRIYKWNEVDNSWRKKGSDIDGEAPGDQAGSNYIGSGEAVSLSFDGSVVAIGSMYNDGDNGLRSGHVRVFEWKKNEDVNSWNQRGADIDGEHIFDESGRALSLSSDGKVVAIGARSNDDNGYLSGHVRVYEWNEVANYWKQKGNDMDGEDERDQFGTSISLSSDGSVVAIGAVFGGLGNSGHVSVFKWKDP